MLRHSLLSLLCLAAAKVSAAPFEDTGYTLEDDIKVYGTPPRGAGGLSGSRVGMKLWRHGKVNYYIDPEGTASHDPGVPLDINDARVLEAVEHWNEHTCIEFTRCMDLDACPRPVMRFVSQGSGCSAPLGRVGSVVTVDIGPDCSVGNTIHEIGHSIGLNHEQRRNDRDDFIGIHWRNVGTGNSNYHKLDRNGGNGRAIGPYDYGSIMHYPMNPWRTTITVPAEYHDVVGQRIALSPLDIASVHFMYNYCSDKYDAPVCVASRDEDLVHTVRAGVESWIEFNAQYSRAMTVDFASGTTPAALPRAQTSTLFEGPNDGIDAHSGRAVFQYTASAEDVGLEYVLAARFVAEDGAECTKALTVRVAPGPTPVPTPAPPAPEHLCAPEDIAAASNVIDYPAGAGKYSNLERVCWRLACDAEITFDWRHFDLEKGWDFLTLSDDGAAELARLTGAERPALAAVQGPVVLAFKSDSSTTKTGFELSWSCAGTTPRPPTPTPAPTALPETAVPQTAIPETAIPDTFVPDTAAPETPVPPTPTPTAAPTPAPSTPAPTDAPTPVPSTPAPPTAAPATDAPAPPTPATPPAGELFTMKQHGGSDVVTANLGSIADGYPGKYPSSTSGDVWVMGRRCLITWTFMDVEAHDTCRYDYVEIRDGSTSVGRFCGAGALPEPIQLEGSFFQVYFNADTNTEGEGFAFDFVCEGAVTAAPAAAATPAPPTPAPLAAGAVALTTRHDNGAVVTAQAGSVGDGYPNRYTNSLNQRLTVVGTDCRLVFTAFDVEYHSQCGYDALVIEAGGEVVARLCGGRRPDPVELVGDSFDVVFTTDSSTVKTGFAFDFECRAATAAERLRALTRRL